MLKPNFLTIFLKEDGDTNTGLPEIQVYDSGKKEWNSYNVCPPENIDEKVFFLSRT